MIVKIERGFTMPHPTIKPHQWRKFPDPSLMEIGESYVVKGAIAKTNGYYHLRKFEEKNLQAVIRDTPKGMRVWRYA